MSGSEWETTPLWLLRSGSLRSFLYISSAYLSITSWALQLLLGLYHFCPLLCPSLDEMFFWYFQFSCRDFQSYPFCCFPLSLCIVHWRRPSCLSLLFSGTLCLAGCMFPFFPSLFFFFNFYFIFKLYTIVLVLPNIKMNPPQLFFFPQLFVKPPQPLCLLAFVFVWHGFVHCLMYIVILHCSLKTFLSLLAILWNSVFSWMYVSLSP